MRRVWRVAALGLSIGYTMVLIGCGSKDVATADRIPSVAETESHVNETSTDEFRLTIQSEPYGKTTDGRGIQRYLMTNRQGLKVAVIDYGAIVTSVEVPDREGRFENITLHFDSLAEYEQPGPYLGALCGRYANRIAEGRFFLDEVEYQLATNNGPNHLHGGKRGFDKAVWTAEPITEDEAVGVRLTYVSPDGEEGFPGELTTTVVYTLSNDDRLTIDYTAQVRDKATPLNLTNHCYWNLSGAGSGDVLEHQLTLNCDHYLPVDATLIPTGEFAPVAGTPMDFTSAQSLGARIGETEGGYDHCYVINGKPGELRFVAKVRDPKTGRVMEVQSTEPGVQLYTGNFLDGTEASGGYAKHGGFCLECQHFPDSPNQPSFPSTILRPREVYRQTTVHHFSTDHTTHSDN